MSGGCLVKPKEYPNIPALFGFLIAQHVATLHELRTVYSFADAMYMYEAVQVPKYNEWRETQAQENNKAKR
jgi:hypothetical protein